MIEELGWAALGIAAGVVAGLVPGIHSNTIAFMALLLPLEKNLSFAVFLTSMSVTNSIVDAVPTILLGAPSEENAAGILPGHEMLMRGRGLEAIMLVVFGGLSAIIAGIFLLPVFYSLATKYETVVPIVIPVVTAASFAMMVASEKKALHALAVAVLSGALGIISLQKVENAVFVLITGFFGITGLVETVTGNVQPPKQTLEVSGKTGLRLPLLAAFTSGFTALFPGIGPTQATVTITNFVKGIDSKSYLVLTGGINVGNVMFSILMLYAIEKGRTGLAVALQNFISMDLNMLFILLAAAAMAAGAAVILTEKIAVAAASKVTGKSYRKISALVLAFLVALVGLTSGVHGLIACLAATGTALFCTRSGVRRSQCMAFLLFPTLVFYLG